MLLPRWSQDIRPLPRAKQDSEQRTGRKWGRLEENPVLDKSVTQALQWIRGGAVDREERSGTSGPHVVVR